MGKRLVLAGGGHAHMMLLGAIGDIIAQGHTVTVIQPSDYHYYSGMGPGLLSTVYTADDIRFQTRFVVERQGGAFLRGKVLRVDTGERKVVTEEGDVIEYDVLSCNVGSFVPFDAIEGESDNIFSAKPIERLIDAQQRICDICRENDSISIGVIGGGPAAVEIAGNCYHLAKTQACKDITIRLFAGRKLMADFNPSLGKIIRKTFAEYGITIDEGGYVERITDGRIFVENGTSHTPDIIFLATGVRPSKVFRDSNISTGDDGGLLVNAYLQSVDSDRVFGGGDCISFSPRPLAKVGVYAVRENPILLHNVMARLNNEPFHPFDPGGNYLLIFNLGRGTGALQKGSFIWGGRLSFLIKDYIDRKFIRRFQKLEK